MDTRRHWARFILTNFAALAGVGLILIGLAAFRHLHGPALLAGAAGLLLVAASAYSILITDWWAAELSPPLQPHETLLASIAPFAGLLLGGGFMLAALLVLAFLFQLHRRSH